MSRDTNYRYKYQIEDRHGIILLDTALCESSRTHPNFFKRTSEKRKWWNTTQTTQNKQHPLSRYILMNETQNSFLKLLNLR